MRNQYGEPSSGCVFLMAVFIIGGAIGLFFWLTKPFAHDGKITGFRVEAIASYQELRMHTSIVKTGKVSVPVIKWTWDTQRKITNALDDRSDPNITCRYDSEISDSEHQRWQCQVTHYLAVSFDGRSGYCSFDPTRWAYIELNSKVTVNETRLGLINCN